VAKAPQGGRGGAPQAPPVDPKYNWTSTPRTVVGTRVKRLDGPDKVSGRAKYTFDITRPGMLYGRIIRSPYPHAKVVSVELAPAQRVSGFRPALLVRDAQDDMTSVVITRTKSPPSWPTPRNTRSTRRAR
jgi:CO/xanthine dehydrogenase Mo-binding subunit